jgi:hypothetical protein
MAKRGWYVSCKGLRCGDRPKKQVVLNEIAANKSRENTSYLFFTAVSSSIFTCVIREVVLMYFTDKSRIDAFDTRIEVSDWSELSEGACA